MRKQRIVLSHDESTFRTGEMSNLRWLFPGLEPFFNKGRGRSIMVSAFIVKHSVIDIFYLNESEWKTATEKHPGLLKQDTKLNYYDRSANAYIEPKKDHYFDNQTILKQFERLFIMLTFKKEFEKHQIEIIVDNARTHTAKKYLLNLFNKKPGTNCVYKKIEWTDDDGIDHE